METLRLTGPNHKEYLIPRRQKEDWDWWVDLHSHEGMPRWTPPIYSKEVTDD